MSLHRCEGPDLAELLASVQRDMGENATVVSAEKVRRGGVGGFFAREWYELSVEVPDGINVPATSDATSSLDAVVSDTLDVLDLSAIGRMKEELASIDDEAPGATLPSTEHHEFADVLASLAGLTSSKPVPTAAEFEVVSRRPASVPDATPPIEPPAATDAPTSVAEPIPAGQEPWTFDPAMSSAREADPVEQTPRSTALAGLGVPRQLLVAFADTDPESWAGSMGALLPLMPSLPRLPGSILAVIGSAETALPQAMELAKRIGAPDQLYVARRTNTGIEVPPAYLLPDGDAVLERSRRFARSNVPTTVAILLDGDADGTSWLVDVMRHLTPDQTWLSVRAGARAEDVATLSALVGGADVLCLNDVGATGAPATLLGLDLPIAQLDGVLATPRRWAALLIDRLQGAAADRLAAGVTGAAATSAYDVRSGNSKTSAAAPGLGVVLPIHGGGPTRDATAADRPAFSKLRRSGSS
jgi:hypothetical protein